MNTFVLQMLLTVCAVEEQKEYSLLKTSMYLIVCEWVSKTTVYRLATSLSQRPCF